MKRKTKSAAIVALFLLALAGCDSVKSIFADNQVPKEVLAEPRDVEVPPSLSNKNYPLVGNVPPKPKDFITKADSAKAIQQMNSETTQADTLKEQIENQPNVPTPSPQTVAP